MDIRDVRIMLVTNVFTVLVTKKFELLGFGAGFEDILGHSNYLVAILKAFEQTFNLV